MRLVEITNKSEDTNTPASIPHDTRCVKICHAGPQSFISSQYLHTSHAVIDCSRAVRTEPLPLSSSRRFFHRHLRPSRRRRCVSRGENESQTIIYMLTLHMPPNWRPENPTTRLIDQRQDRGSRWHTRTWWWQSKQTLPSCLPLFELQK